MRGLFEHQPYGFPAFHTHFGPWGQGFGGCGRDRPEWPDFKRPGCSSYGPPGFNHGPNCQRRHRPDHDGCRSPSPLPREGDERSAPPEHDHQHGPSERENQEDSQCKHRGPSGCDQRCHEQRFRGHSPCRGPPRSGYHQHHWHGSGQHGFGSRPTPRDFFDWFGDHHGPHCGHRFGHRRPSPYDRFSGHLASRDWESCHRRPCCSRNKERVYNEKTPGRKEKESCCARNKDENMAGDTVFVQRIIVERPSNRPRSV